jgi:imidazolonepropionase-like amidohydrolase
MLMSRRLAYLALAPVVTLALVAAIRTNPPTAPAVSPPALAIVHATLVNPNAPAVPDAVVVFQGGRVTCAGPRTTCTVPQGATTRDAAGGYVTPGLIDAHVHYSQTAWLDGRPDAGDVRARFPYDSVAAYLRDHPERFDRAYLCSGVTSVFDVGGYPWSLSMARGHEQTLTAPRMVAAGPLLTTIDFWLNLPFERQFVFMSSDSAVRSGVSALARMGASAIKVWYIQVPDSLQATMRHRLTVAGEEARRVGLPLIVHATELARAKEALAAGAHVLVHNVDDVPVDSEFIALAKKNNAIVIPTLVVVTGYEDLFRGRSPGLRYPLDCVDKVTRSHIETPLPENMRAPAARLDRLTSVPVRSAHNLALLVAAHIPVAMGTDAGNPGTAPGPSVYAEMEAMQAAGMSASAVFASATIGAARAMGRERELGSLETNKLADAVVFDADPTADIANARKVRLVVRGGAVYTRAELLPQP